ncbi:MAG: heavy metal translocating P-type ATPase, partial [Actinobacteria bacterium]
MDNKKRKDFKKNNKKKGQEKITLPLKGMSCASCVIKVEDSLKSVEGVKSANVNLATEKATVEYETEKVKFDDLAKAVDSAGYMVSLEEETFDVEGMSCASCVKKVEDALLSVNGVEEASVNLATEKATVKYVPPLPLKEMKKAVENVGYKLISIKEPSRLKEEEKEILKDVELNKLRNKFYFSLFMGILIFLGSTEFIPGVVSIPQNVRFFIMFLLATPVQFWAGWQIYVGAYKVARHGSTNMDTLIAMGTSAAYFFSVIATFFPELFTSRGLEVTVYYDTAALIIALILLGRYLEAKAKGRTTEAIKKLMGLRAKTARVIR